MNIDDPMTFNELTWDLGPGVVARPFELGEEAAIFATIQANRAHLDRWLLWSNTVQVEADAAATIAKYVAKRAIGAGFNNGIWVDGRLAGGIVCREMDHADRWAEIGYWLSREFTGRGLATIASSRATSYLLLERQMHRVFMRCAAGNVRSRAVPERLGYRLEGIHREAHRLNDQFIDQAVYAVLATEWQT